MVIKKPDTKEEYEEIFKLNYETFVEEIPQHEKRTDRKLIDKFHTKNNYLIAVHDDLVIGMVCYNTQRPFSLDLKNVEIDKLIPTVSEVAEIRLLAIKKKWRKTPVTYQILDGLTKVLLDQNIDFGFISAATRQLEFYNKIGFIPFGEIVGKKGASYQPMYISIANLNKIFKKW